MAFVIIPPGSTDPGSPLDQLLMDTIRENQNDLNARAGLKPVNFQTGAVNANTTNMVWDDTIPQNDEGEEYMTLAITPTSATNKLRIDVVLNGSASGATANIVMALFQDSTVNALAATHSDHTGSDDPDQIVLTHFMTAGTTSATIFKIRAGSTSGDFTFNGSAGARKLGGVMASSITITEVQP